MLYKYLSRYFYFLAIPAEYRNCLKNVANILIWGNACFWDISANFHSVSIIAFNINHSPIQKKEPQKYWQQTYCCVLMMKISLLKRSIIFLRYAIQVLRAFLTAVRAYGMYDKEYQVMAIDWMTMHTNASKPFFSCKWIKNDECVNFFSIGNGFHNLRNWIIFE